MKIYFSHGKESGPWGTKISHLAELTKDRSFEVESIDYSDVDDPDLRAERLLTSLRSEPDLAKVVLVGSSMGGYVSTVASLSVPVRGLFLLAPALYMPGYQHQEYPTPCRPITVIHGWRDDVIPFEHSVRFCAEHRADLHLIDGDHRLNNNLTVVGAHFQCFLKKTLTTA
jgi:fermentation-respiration switch protein FrsA (DUF1100 family)